MLSLLQRINQLVWGIPALLLILGVGIYLSIRTGHVQIILFPQAVKTFLGGFRKKSGSKSGVSAYRAMCTALAATVGTGNLAGVAGAIAIGGPGAVFWMWICGILGMVTKFAEATLAVRYRKRGSDGQYMAGPMYMIRQGLGEKWKWLAWIYCFFGVVAAFGVGNATQVNTVIQSINGILVNWGKEPGIFTNLWMGLILAAVFGALLKGGASRIGAAAEVLVPFASLLYIGLGALVLILQRSAIIPAFSLIIEGAFSPKAVTGGVIGSCFTVLRVGASRGVFTNEAGMGTASIAHGSAEVEHPVQQGLMGMVEVFLDTIVICTVTALVILCSGVIIPYGTDTGIELTCDAFSHILGDWVQIPIAGALCLFATATVLGWGLYGGRCAQYLFGENSWNTFVNIQIVTVVIGALLQTGTVWLLSDIVNGLMAIPNLVALLLLSPELIRLVKEYKRRGLNTRAKD